MDTIIAGIGGCGIAALEKVAAHRLYGLRCIAIDTYQGSLDRTVSDSLLIGEPITQGMGAGGNAEVGQRAAQSSLDALDAAFRDYGTVILLLGAGGGTGSGAAPVIAQLAWERGQAVIAIVSEPFDHEGQVRRQIADECLGLLRAHCGDVIVLDNHRLTAYARPGGLLGRARELRVETMAWAALARLF